MKLFILYIKKMWYVLVHISEKIIEINKQIEEIKKQKAEKKSKEQ